MMKFKLISAGTGHQFDVLINPDYIVLASSTGDNNENTLVTMSNDATFTVAGTTDEIYNEVAYYYETKR